MPKPKPSPVPLKETRLRVDASKHRTLIIADDGVDTKKTRAWAGVAAPETCDVHPGDGSELLGTRLGFSVLPAQAPPTRPEPRAEATSEAPDPTPYEPAVVVSDPPPPVLPETVAAVSAQAYGEQPPIRLKHTGTPRWLLVFAVASSVVGVLGFGLALTSFLRTRASDRGSPPTAVKKLPSPRPAAAKPPTPTAAKPPTPTAAKPPTPAAPEPQPPVSRVAPAAAVVADVKPPVERPAARPAMKRLAVRTGAGAPARLPARTAPRTGARPARRQSKLPGTGKPRASVKTVANQKRRGVRVRYDRAQNVVDVFLPLGDDAPRVSVVRQKDPQKR